MGEPPLLPIVLLVDADPGMHNLFGRIGAKDWAILGARSGMAAVKIAAKRAPAVVAIDTGLADKDAAELVAELRAIEAQLRVVFLSRTQDADEAAKLKPLGAILVKPADTTRGDPIFEERFRQAVKNALRLRGMSEGVEHLRTQTGQFRLELPTPPSRREPR